MDNPQTPSINRSKNVNGLFGWDLHTWEDTMVIFLCVTAMVALIVGVATWQVVRLQRMALKQSDEEFSERAEILKSQLAWRVIPEDVANTLTASLAKAPGAVNVRYNDGDPEALFLAIQLSNMLKAS